MMHSICSTFEMFSVEPFAWYPPTTHWEDIQNWWHVLWTFRSIRFQIQLTPTDLIIFMVLVTAYLRKVYQILRYGWNQFQKIQREQYELTELGQQLEEIEKELEELAVANMM